MKLSIIIPTYNNEKTIYDCLKSIFVQDFPKENFEVLIVDGGSEDNTVKIAKEFNTVILKNPDRIEEKGKMRGIRNSKGKVLCFIDADNILLEKDWIKKMMSPFGDKEIAFSETLYYSYLPSSKMSVKYHGLVGGDDPVAVYLGISGRWCYFRDDWTNSNYPYTSENLKDYFKIRMKDKEKIPALGANGLMIRKDIMKKNLEGSFIHSDLIYRVINSGHNCFAKVKVGIVHNQPTFFKNKLRRIKRRFNKEITIKYNYGVKKSDIIKTLFYICLVFPVLYDSFKGFFRKPSSAWIFHPIATYSVLLNYFIYGILGKITNG